MCPHVSYGKTPRDPNQLAKLIVDIATGEAEDTVSQSKRQPSKRGRAGGLKGGNLRVAKLTPERRSQCQAGRIIQVEKRSLG